jgi:hypothetical protein
MYTQLYAGFVKKPDDSPGTLDFILMCAGLALIVTLGVSNSMTVSTLEVTLKDTLQPSQFRLCYAILVAMGVTVTTAAFVGESVSSGAHAALAVVILLIWLSPTLLLTKWFAGEEEEEDDEGRGIKSDPLLESNDGGDECYTNTKLPQLTLKEMLRTSRCYLLLWTCTFLIGTITSRCYLLLWTCSFLMLLPHSFLTS